MFLLCILLLACAVLAARPTHHPTHHPARSLAPASASPTSLSPTSAAPTSLPSKGAEYEYESKEGWGLCVMKGGQVLHCF